MEISEQTKLKFNGVDIIKWLGWLIVAISTAVWVVKNTYDNQEQTLKEHEMRLVNIETKFDKLEGKVDAGFIGINDKLDKVGNDLKTQIEADKEIILKHEYVNFNKPYQQYK